MKRNWEDTPVPKHVFVFSAEGFRRELKSHTDAVRECPSSTHVGGPTTPIAPYRVGLMLRLRERVGQGIGVARGGGVGSTPKSSGHRLIAVTVLCAEQYAAPLVSRRHAQS